MHEEVGLPITVGVARTKFLAKVASGVAKPDGLLVVPPGGELEFLHPLAAERLWGVGPVTARKLHGAGLETVGQVARRSEAAPVELLGRAPGAISTRSRTTETRARFARACGAGRSGAQRALRASGASAEELDVDPLGLVDRLARRLRGADRVCRTVVLRLRFGDFTNATRSRTFSTPTARHARRSSRRARAARRRAADDRASAASR